MMSDALYKTGTRFILKDDSDGEGTLYTIEQEILRENIRVYVLSYVNKNGVSKILPLSEHILDLSVKDDTFIIIR